MWTSYCGQTFSQLDAERVRRRSLAMPRPLSGRRCWTSTVPGRGDRLSLTLSGTYGDLCSWPNKGVSYPNLRNLKLNAGATLQPSPPRRRRKKKAAPAWQNCEQRWQSGGPEHECFAAKQADPRNPLPS
ncbi:hypothetical protein G6F35_017699 [Rhizopus arrhizus]|nr:hypothetical protein G6F35_017699 [Rhizopus arrhizus]